MINLVNLLKINKSLKPLKLRYLRTPDNFRKQSKAFKSEFKPYDTDLYCTGAKILFQNLFCR